jgi:alkaline phosphatase D
MRTADPARALAEFHDGAWRDPSMTMMGTEQESWLYHGFAREKAIWSVLGVGTNMGYNYLPESAMATISPDSPQRNRDYVQTGVRMAKAGLPYNLDNWGGYPAARSRLLAAAQRSGRDLVVVTGDSHNGWGYDLPEGGKPAGVEFGGHSVTSPGFEQATKGIDPKTVAAALINKANPELRWVDTSNRGYMHLSLTPQAATNEWVFMDTVLDVSRVTRPSHRLQVRPGRRVLEAV